MRVLSVDLGTSNTVAVLSAHGRPPRVVDVDGASMMPSAVFATEDGTLVAGREAERRARLDPSRFEPNPKRRIDEGTLLLGDKIVPVTDALAAVLRKVAEETARQLGGAMADEVRLTHPAQWGPVRRNVLLSAARQAGFGPGLVLVPEPVAAAAHFASFPGQSLPPGQALAVYDLGAGTFDVAVVGATPNGFMVLAEAGLPDLGGLDVDQALLQHVGQQVAHRDQAGWHRLLVPVSTVDRRAARALREDVRAAKEALSSHPQTDLPMPQPFEDVLVTRIELEALIRPNLVRSVELLAATIRSTGLRPDRLAGIYLVGGSSRIPLIASLIAEHLRVVPTSLDQPETAVALGAQHEHRAPQQAPTPLMPQLVPPQPVAPQPLGPPSGALPHMAPPPPPQPRYALPAPSGPPPVATAARRTALPWLLGAGGLVVVGVIVLIIALSGNGGSGSPGTQGGGGGSTASGAGACQGKSGDQCLQEVIGPVAGKADCSPMDSAGRTTVAAVECRWGDEQVVRYVQYRDMAAMQDELDTNPTMDGAQRAGWSGNGMEGEYAAQDGTQLAFWLKDRPIAGYLNTTRKPADELIEIFNRDLRPGS